MAGFSVLLARLEGRIQNTAMALPLKLSLGLIGLLALAPLLGGELLSPGKNLMSSAQGQPHWGIESTPTPPPRSDPPPPMADDDRYRQVIERTRSMIDNPEAQRLARQYGLNIVDLTWEDTARYHNSAVGPNISDMTIQIQQYNPRTKGYELSLMPVIRFPNFSDRTADIPLERFFILVGNEKGQSLRRVNLKEFLGNFRNYLHNPRSWAGNRRSLLADRDSHVLVSAQACFLPISPQGEATFNPVLFNYQSYEKNPAVLAILATRQGTSATVIDNKRDAFAAGQTWGQRLFFNKNGERASLVGQRASDFGRRSGGREIPSAQAEAAGMNMVMVIQVPLKQTPRPRPAMPGPALMEAAPSVSRSNVEAAVISYGRVEGPFTEIDNLPIERDPRFPIRVTVQFYKATDNGVVSAKDMRHIRDQIAKVYSNADDVGSLVIDGDRGRPTEYTGSKQEPPGWWEDFWQRHEQNTGQTREEALEMLRRLRGKDWLPRSQQELEQALKALQQSPQ
ncbi:tlr1038 [Thermosynechococcus vestitus BP-1]|uniref:Tlr1038 protein n=2 Tax=Thermosynechococcus vestitus TaxID=146786 RepID=Q8DK32_THEVB|nr:tlr1038 [Thermosynechococcus vestitus BP-1]